MHTTKGRGASPGILKRAPKLYKRPVKPLPARKGNVMPTNNINTSADYRAEIAPQVQGCISIPDNHTIAYPPSALDEFSDFLRNKWHYILVELHMLSRLGPCTIKDIDIQYHIRKWINEGYFLYANGVTARDINPLLENLGLSTLDEDSFYELEEVDVYAAGELFRQKLDEAIDYMQNGIYQNWNELCEEIDYARDNFSDRKRIARDDSFIPSKGFVPPEQYSPAMRKILFDCFCYMYEEIKYVPRWYHPEMDDFRLECAISVWFEHMYCRFGDARHGLIALHLLEEIFGIDKTNPMFKVPSGRFWRYARPANRMFSVLPYSSELSGYMLNCLIDLWDELEDEYIKADFHKIHLADFAPMEE